MTESKHTKGPWEYYRASNYSGFAIAPAGRLPTLAAVDEKRLSITAFNFPAETEANARLIAAAPDAADIVDEVIALIDPACTVENDIYGDSKETNERFANLLRAAWAAKAKITGQDQ